MENRISRRKMTTAARAITAMSTVAASFVAAPASASDSSSGSAAVTARIPVSCNIETRDFVLQSDNSAISGLVFEACNTNRGFQIVASHRALADGEDIRVLYGFNISQLRREGMSPIAMRSGARFGAVPVQIRAPSIDQPIAIRFSMIAI